MKIHIPEHLIRFIRESNHPNQANSKITVETDAVSLGAILPIFEEFLRGCGFHFNGRIDIIDEEEKE